MRRYYKSGGKVKSGGKICPAGKAWAKRTFDTYPSAYANMAASKYCSDPNYAKGSKKKKKSKQWDSLNSGVTSSGFVSAPMARSRAMRHVEEQENPDRRLPKPRRSH